MSYDISYRIINKKTGSLIFTNSNTSCFAELHSNGSDIKFNSSYSIQVYRNKEKILLSDEDFKKYIELLNDNGFKVSYKEVGKKDEIDNYPHPSFLGEVNIEYTLDFSDYKTKQHLKLALHLIRFTFEVKSHELIEDSLEYIKNNPECSILEAIRIVQGYSNKHYNTGHTIFTNGIPTSPITKELFEECFFEKEYSNDELYYLVKSITIPKKVELSVKNSYKEHLKYFNIETNEV